MINKLDIGELHVLFRVFYAFKYGTDDEGRDELLRSSIFSNIFHEILNQLLESYNKIETIDGSQAGRGEWHIVNRDSEQSKIIDHLSRIDAWRTFEYGLKVQLAKIMLSPFIFSESDVIRIVERVDSRLLK